MRGSQLVSAVSVLGVASLVASCADKAVAPREEVIVPFAIGAEQRATLGAALRFATREEVLSALAEADARARVVETFARLSEHVARNDRAGARRAIVAARETLRLYRERSGSDPGTLLELEALSLALDHAELLAGDDAAAAAYGGGPRTNRGESGG